VQKGTDVDKSALILFAHGARDPRWAAPFQRLQALVKEQLPQQEVELAFLELMEPRLPEVVSKLTDSGCNQVTIVPVFLGQGGHVLRDLPMIMQELQQVHPEVSFKLVDAVGENPAVLQAMARYCVDAGRP
jgi:sirohydrochlorin cobaltochelatase